MTNREAANWDADGIRAIAKRHSGREGPLLPILHDIQHEYGCIPRAAVPVVAQALNLSRAEVHGVVTFYHDFRYEPSGRHTVQLCGAEACQSTGCAATADHARRRLGIGFDGTTADGAVTLRQVYCLGNCALGPAVMIDGELHGRVTPQRLDALLAGIGVR